MPLPKPRKHESKKDFLNSCMGNSIMNKEWSDNSQRFAICNSLWIHKKAKASYVIEVGDNQYIDEWDNPNPLQEIEKNSNVKDKDKKSDSNKNSDTSKSDDTKAMLSDEQKDLLRWNNTNPANPQHLTKGMEIEPYFPSLNGPGLAQNPDNSTAPLDDDGKPDLTKMQWYMGKDGNIEYLDPNNEGLDDKVKQWFISRIEKDLAAEWPQSYEKIEKHFNRPNKGKLPKAMEDMNKDRGKQNAEQVQKDYNPFGL